MGDLPNGADVMLDELSNEALKALVRSHWRRHVVITDEATELRQQLAEAVATLERIRDYPEEGNPRRTSDGYPVEVVHDEFAYRRVVDSYREAASDCLNALNPPCCLNDGCTETTDGGRGCSERCETEIAAQGYADTQEGG